MKPIEKEKSIQLRKKGLSYSDIAEQIPVSRSTLSLWLREVKLSQRKRQALVGKRVAFAKRGAEKRRQTRLAQTRQLHDKALEEVGLLSTRDLFLLGIALYWAEGAKQKEHNVSQRVCFSNQDIRMIRIFLLWLGKICNVAVSDIAFELYIHEAASYRNAVDYWRRELGLPEGRDIPVRFKKDKVGTKRKNVTESYRGLLRVTVLRSTELNRKISGWIAALI